jgi:hypothetical protein
MDPALNRLSTSYCGIGFSVPDADPTQLYPRPYATALMLHSAEEDPSTRGRPCASGLHLVTHAVWDAGPRRHDAGWAESMLSVCELLSALAFLPLRRRIAGTNVVAFQPFWIAMMSGFTLTRVRPP